MFQIQITSAAIFLLYLLAWASAPILARRRWGTPGALLAFSTEIAVALLISGFYPPVSLEGLPPALAKQAQVIGFVLFTAAPIAAAACGTLVAAVWPVAARLQR